MATAATLFEGAVIVVTFRRSGRATYTYR